MKASYLIIIILFLLQSLYPQEEIRYTDPRFSFEFEVGPVWQSLNDVQIPNSKEGTRFSLADFVGNVPFPSSRLYITWNISQRHGVRLLLAPFAYKKSGEFTSPVNFAGETFEPGLLTDATYKFNSWRLTYRYRFYKNTRWLWKIGFTSKIRDAKIQLEQPGKSAQKTDVGFVPLLHISGTYIITDKWSIRADIDALAGGPGRAEDVSLFLSCKASEHWRLSTGYRTLEGGADVEEVYNFAWFNFLVISTAYEF
jgi:hypothetical protein